MYPIPVVLKSLALHFNISVHCLVPVAQYTMTALDVFLLKHWSMETRRTALVGTKMNETKA